MKSSSGRLVQPHALQFNVLLVDDDRFTHELMSVLLRDTEFTLISAFNAEEAMKIITSKPPDIVITDGMMPGESGFSLIERIKSNPTVANLPVLLLTMLTRADGSVMDASGKADFLISKPLHSSDILESLRLAKILIAKHSGKDDEVTISFEPPAADTIDIVF